MTSRELCILAALFAASPSVCAAAKATQPDVLDGWWRIGEVDGKAVPAATRKRTYLILHDGSLSGRDGCNGYWGTYQSMDHGLRIEIEGINTASCTVVDDPDLMTRGGQVTMAAAKVESFRSNKGRLELIARGRIVLLLTRAPEADRINQLFLGGVKHLPILSDPHWTVRPSQRQMLEHFSPGVGQRWPSVQAVCSVDGAGGLTGCSVIYPSVESGSPDFEPSLLKVAPNYRLSPADTRLVRKTSASVLLEFNLSQKQ